MSFPRATDALFDLLVDGEDLLRAAPSAGEQEDFHLWRADLNRWAEQVAAALEAVAPLDAAADFVQVISTPMSAGDWQLVLPRELGRVRDAMAPPAALQQLSRRRRS
jgi:hypothetical protein